MTKKKLLAVALTAGILISSYGIYDLQAASVEDLQQQQQELEDKGSALQEKQDSLNGTMSGLNSDLNSLSASMSTIQDEIDAKQSEIETAEADLEQAQTDADEQYEAMKLRIQYSYENGGTFSWTTLFEADGIVDFINRASYMSEIAQSDRELLKTYDETLQGIEEKKTALESEKEELLAKQEELESNKTQLLSSISQVASSISDNQKAMDENSEQADALAEQIAAAEELEAQLEAQKAAEAAAQLEQAKAMEEEMTKTPDTSGTPVSVQASEAELLAALIYCEAGGESYAGQVAVGSVVVNRVNSTYFPGSITDVIYQSGQFSPVASGKLALVLANGLTTDSCRNAANQVIGGGVSGSWLFFCVNTGSIEGTVIDHQVFY